ncbi:hypothetical protein [Flavobacterium orientale]|uniref:MAC/Perforin domain-containing protein n=1 Tax=Flavobacterium orientale TaxID=1756020 RepID=A0A916Y081_9FLAO|nr:hypothetical protein [Flavobacterium orientale]GGD24419.1 hypothetical protein GCM10011343_13240 [Flavobacterium orientale]
MISYNFLAQSTSVFDANYFNTDNSQPSIKVGKGFHINDIYKQTKNCFKSETINPNKLTSQQVGGKKTSIKLFYTKSNKDFNDYKSRGNTGSVSFLNLFEFNGKKLDEYSNASIEEVERLIFSANVDFGIYSFDKEPILTDEANNLIKQNKLQEFVKLFGTHYISGVKKESNIVVILKKNYTEKNFLYNTKTNINSNGNIPFKGKSSLEIDNSDWVNNQLRNNSYSVTVEINGPAIEQSVIQNQINAILNGTTQNKANAISDIIGSAIKNISDPNQSVITQYYYSPFSLYGLEGIIWDSKKQSELIKLNELLINLYRDRTVISRLIETSSIDEIVDEYQKNQVTPQLIKLVQDKRNETVVRLKKYSSELENLMHEIEQRYNSCSDIYCSINSECCSNNEFISRTNTLNYENKIKEDLMSFYNVLNEVNKEVNKPECEKKQQGVIVIENHSINPYDLFHGNKFIETLQGKTAKTFYVNNGNYTFKAVQKSGYLMYPTENIRSANITNVCQEVVLKIGF